MKEKILILCALLGMYSFLFSVGVPDAKADRTETAGLLVGISLKQMGAAQKKPEKKFVKKYHNLGRDARRHRPIPPATFVA